MKSNLDLMDMQANEREAISQSHRTDLLEHAAESIKLIPTAKEKLDIFMAAVKSDAPGGAGSHSIAADGASPSAMAMQRVAPNAFELDIVFADELPSTFVPPDEIVEGLLIAGGASVIYGDSNCGKTFLVIDMTCAIARGIPWMGRQTNPGLVIYLAAESPASARSRLQAYQTHHGVRVPNFAIVQSPIDLFNGDGDTGLLIEVIRKIETQKGQRVRLIVGDTLARLSAGANENAGQDMGLVVRRIDRIRVETGAHFALVHHCGKNAAAGQRGWSGVRGAVDSEFEVTDTPTGRCCEITKQRDLGTKGERIGFRLDTVTLGQTKWGSPATSCVVSSVDAPVKQKGRRTSEVGGAIVEFLGARQSGIKKRELVAYFGERYTPSAVYRELKHMVEGGQAFECAGVVSLIVKGAN